MLNIALIFPGQASQHVGMGKQLYDNFSYTREIFENACDLLKFDIKKLCFEGPMQDLTLTRNTQPALLLCSYVAYTVLERELSPHLVGATGHSLGEISALACSGALSFADALMIVRKRGIFMESALGNKQGKMAAITNLSTNEVEALCKEFDMDADKVVVSNYNAPGQTVVSGLADDIDLFCKLVTLHNGMSIPLQVSAPFHSPYMLPAAMRFQDELQDYRFRDFKFPVLSNMDGKPYDSADSIPQNLVGQITAAVRWDKCMRNIQGYNADLIVEVGPKSVLKNLAVKNSVHTPCLSMGLADDFQQLQKKQHRLVVNTSESIVAKCLCIAVSTRNRNWNQDEYETGVINEYRKIEEIQQKLELEVRMPSLEETNCALHALRTILVSKKLPEQEVLMLFEELAGENIESDKKHTYEARFA